MVILEFKNDMQNKNKYSVSIIIPNLNGENIIENNFSCVLVAMDNPANCITEIIVVDDFSSDKSVEIIRKKFPGIKLIRHTKHRGFSAAVNTGVRASLGNLLALINNDVLPQKDFLVPVIPHFDNPDIFAVSMHEKGYGWGRGVFKDGYIANEQGGETKETQTTFWVSGGSGIFRKSYWTLLGGLDEALLSPFTWEDFDICYRASKRGYKLLWEPKSRVVHEHETTTKMFPKKYYDSIKERNQLLVIWKNITSPNLLRKHVLGVFSRAIKHPGYLRIVLMALGKIKLVLARRKRETKEGKVSDEAIFAKFQ